MPTNKMLRFTARARRILSLAQAAAEEYHHNYIGTEHLLVALMREERGVAGRVLRDLGLEQRRVEELVEELTRATARTHNTALDLSSGTKRVLELAVDEARRMGHHYIGTEHLLLGLVRQSEGVAIDVLKRLGVSPEEVRRQTRRVLQERPTESTQVAPPVEVPTQSARVGPPKNQTLHLTVTDTNTGMVKFDLALPFDQVEAILDSVYDLIDAGEGGNVIVETADHAQRIEIRLDEQPDATEDDDAH